MITSESRWESRVTFPLTLGGLNQAMNAMIERARNEGVPEEVVPGFIYISRAWENSGSEKLYVLNMTFKWRTDSD